MKKIFFLAATAFLLAGPATFANGGKKQDCSHCTKENCKGVKCATCCAHGKCVKG